MIRRFSLEEFDYHLPDDRIAQYPLTQRDSSKLLIWKDGIISQDIFSKIGEYLPDNTTLVFNDTKVIRARLLFIKPTGAIIEVFCLEPIAPVRETVAAFSVKGNATWECLIGNLKRWRSGRIEKIMHLHGAECRLSAEKKENLGNGCFSVEFNWAPDDLTFSAILEMAGLMPLPPYIHRSSEEKDVITYQTVYAINDGSVAAPTAGLHFTRPLLEKIRIKPVSFIHLTLHVGLGTFRPVSSADITEHVMHEERISVTLTAIEQILENTSKNLIAVGTTSVRTLESLYWLGVKLLVDKPGELPPILQWDPYATVYKKGIPAANAISKVCDVLRLKKLECWNGITQVMIIPGYEFKVVDGIITNFHLPKSTLLMLIAAFTGNSWKKMYDYALDHNFRFLSYGDACLLLKTK